MLELNKNIKDYLYYRYNILYHTNFLKFDCDYQILFDDLVSIKKNVYDNNDRIIIEHFDTDFYDKSLTTGLHIRNVIELLHQADIPFFLVMFVTNHYNLEKEIDSLLPDSGADKPKVLKTISSFLTLTDNYINYPIAIEKISKPMVCLMAGIKRSHRQSLYHYIKSNNLFSKIAVSY